jgi:hypothetical protein
MNQPLPYEITIAEKLEQLTVPDMVDAIWARIEKQLDAELPEDDGPGEPPASPKSGPGLGFFGGLIFTGIILFVLFKNHSTSTLPEPVSNAKKLPEIHQQSQPIPQQRDDPPEKPQRKPEVITIGPEEVSLTQPPQPEATAEMVKADSLSATNSTAELEQDLGKKLLPDSLPRKKRGVSGINDREYRIVPKE